MINALFDRNSLHFVGQGRNPLPFEVEVKNVDVTGLSKTVSYQELADKFNEEGKQLYLLPQNPLVEEIGKEVQVETIEVTDTPVLIQVPRQEPLLDSSGKQMQYELTTFDEETGEQVGTGQFIKCYTIVFDEVQKRDENGLKLFYKTETVTEEISTPQPDLEITEDDRRFLLAKDLKKAQILVDKTKILTFDESPNEFTYADIVAQKEKQITSGTFFGKGILFEEMDESIFSTNLSSFNADLGFGFVSLPNGGEVRTVKLNLPQGADLVGIKTETSTDGIVVSIGDTASNLVEVANGEVQFDSPVSQVYVQFENPTDKRIDIYSFALLV
jgi:hypothetical protein